MASQVSRQAVFDQQPVAGARGRSAASRDARLAAGAACQRRRLALAAQRAADHRRGAGRRAGPGAGEALWAAVSWGWTRSAGASVPRRPRGALPLGRGPDLEVGVTGIPAGTRCQFWVTAPRGQDMAAGGWTIAAGHQAVWYPASAPIPAANVRSFAVTAGGKVLVTVAAPRGLRIPARR